MEEIKVTGVKETVEILNEILRTYPKQTVTAGLRNAAKPFVSSLKSSLPSSFSKLPGVKIFTKGESPLIAAGVFSRKKKVSRKKGYMSMFQITYWINHGTLSNRSPAHHFQHPRKTRTKHYPHGTKDWKGGIKASEVVAAAWKASQAQIMAAIPQELKKSTDRFIKRIRRKNGQN